MAKIYVKVIAEFQPDGKLRPLALYYDERKFDIDKVLDIRPAASLKAGGAGIRYTVQIRGQQRYLFLEVDKWFLEVQEHEK